MSNLSRADAENPKTSVDSVRTQEERDPKLVETASFSRDLVFLHKVAKGAKLWGDVDGATSNHRVRCRSTS